MSRVELTPDEERELAIAMHIGESACDRFMVLVSRMAEDDGVDPHDAIFSLWCAITCRLLGGGLDLETILDSAICIDRGRCGQGHVS